MCSERIRKILESPIPAETLVGNLYEEFLDDLGQRTHDNRKQRGNRVQSKFYKLSPKTHTVSFKSIDPGGSGRVHIQDIRFDEFTDIGRENEPIEDRLALAIQAGHVHIRCSCEDFLYKGFKYMAHIGDYGTHQENRPPVIMNPDLEGSICKHLYGVITQIDNFIPEIGDRWRQARGDNYRTQVDPFPFS